VQAAPGELRIFEPEQELGAEGGSGNRGGDGGPAEWGGEGISEAAAEGEVDGEGECVGESFEEEMRVDGVGAQVEIEREGCGLRRGSDGEL
jgi:hypothetical protein